MPTLFATSHTTGSGICRGSFRTRFVTLAAAWLLCIAAGSFGCTDEECAFEDADVAGRGQNPDGIPYPTDSLGGSPRQGSVAGDRVPNFAFTGYVDSNRTAGLKTVSLADYYDPDATRHRLLHLMAAAMWCPYCDGQTRTMVGVVPELRADGVVFVQAIIDGPDPGTPADRCDLDDWVESRSTNFTVVFDSHARRLATIADITGVPWNALIDTRTMEILDAGVGVPADYEAYVRQRLAWVSANPPSY